MSRSWMNKNCLLWEFFFNLLWVRATEFCFFLMDASRTPRQIFLLIDKILNLFFSTWLHIYQTSELGVTEHIEGDPCKFALWAGRTPTSDSKTILKVNYLLEVQTFIVPVFGCVAARISVGFPHALFPPPPQASSMEVKQEWIRNIREVIQERTVHLKGALKEPIHLPKTPSRQRSVSKRSLI